MKPLNLNFVDVPNYDTAAGCKTPSNLRPPLSADAVMKSDVENINPFSPQMPEPATPVSDFVEPRRPSSIRKPQKRIRSPNLDGDCSPSKWILIFLILQCKNLFYDSMVLQSLIK